MVICVLVGYVVSSGNSSNYHKLSSVHVAVAEIFLLDVFNTKHNIQAACQNKQMCVYIVFTLLFH